MAGVLDGIQVLDLATMWAAPLAGAYLADQGAQVIEAEPLRGDEARRTLTTPPLANGGCQGEAPIRPCGGGGPWGW